MVYFLNFYFLVIIAGMWKDNLHILVIGNLSELLKYFMCIQSLMAFVSSFLILLSVITSLVCFALAQNTCTQRCVE